MGIENPHESQEQTSQFEEGQDVIFTDKSGNKFPARIKEIRKDGKYVLENDEYEVNPVVDADRLKGIDEQEGETTEQAEVSAEQEPINVEQATQELVQEFNEFLSKFEEENNLRFHDRIDMIFDLATNELFVNGQQLDRVEVSRYNQSEIQRLSEEQERVKKYLDDTEEIQDVYNAALSKLIDRNGEFSKHISNLDNKLKVINEQAEEQGDTPILNFIDKQKFITKIFEDRDRANHAAGSLRKILSKYRNIKGINPRGL